MELLGRGCPALGFGTGKLAHYFCTRVPVQVFDWYGRSFFADYSSWCLPQEAEIPNRHLCGKIHLDDGNSLAKIR